jgi:hypothetical protein
LFMIRYKLTDQNMQTHNGCKWVLGEEKRTSGEGELCGPGWLHFYDSPLIAVLHNPIHAGIENPRLFKVKVGGRHKDDRGQKCGFTKAKLVKEMPLIAITQVQRTAYGILCGLEVCNGPVFVKWAKNWLNGKDRSAWAAAEAAWVTRVAAWATEAAEAEEAAWTTAAWATRAAGAAGAAAWTAEAAGAAEAAWAAAWTAAAWAAAARAEPINFVKLAERAMRVK